MMRLAVIALLLLAGCGVDGEPEPKNTGIVVSGEARIGVVGSL
jgi:uncharacterized lipoprotein YmbA